MDVINRLVRCPNGHYYNAAIHDFCPVCSGLATAAFHRQEENHINPVSGWLVCVDGPAKGCDYRIHGGYNYIGREIGDICIPGDQKISREKHAVVAYDERDRLFFAGPASGRNLIQINRKTVMGITKIESYDVITVGSTHLMFIAMCGERFDWERGWEFA